MQSFPFTAARTVACATAVAALTAGVAVSQTAVRTIEVPGKSAAAKVWTQPGPNGESVSYYSLSLDGVEYSAAKATSYDLRLRFQRFDPLATQARVPGFLKADAEDRISIVQYWTQGIEDYRAAIRELGGEIHRFLANNANVVEMDPETANAVAQLPFVRSVTPFHPAFRIDPELIAEIKEGTGPITVNILTMRRSNHAPVIEWVEANGGTVGHVSEPTYLMTATVDMKQLPELASLNSVQWINRWAPPENDMNIARQMHGADYVEAQIGLTGTDINVEVLDDGGDTSHPDLQNFIIHNSATTGSHGVCCSGIVMGDGTGNANARGSVPDARLVVARYLSAYSGGSRYAHTGQLIDPSFPYEAVVQSNSWGGGRTLSYNAGSQNMDLILFDHATISITQSQSNANNQMSRPQAWAKNVIACGGINHRNTATKSDDSWGGASIGPAEDGRIKPDLASYYDRILATDRVVGGYAGGNYFSNFGGTSGATPIVAGNLCLLYEMWSNGLFGNPTPGTTPFDNAPNNSTAKALLVNTASQWTFSGVNHNLTRTHQGWGHPDMQKALDRAGNMLIIDETDVLTELQSTTYNVDVSAGQPELKVTLVYRDPPGTTSSNLHRINDLDLKVTGPGGAPTYWGNNGLLGSEYSEPGGSANTVDTVENVFIQNPTAGQWTIEVIASEVNEDSHVETGAVDVDYALVASGVDSGPPAAPAAPTNLTGKGIATAVRIFWDDNANNETNYEVERSLDNGTTWSLLATIAANREVYTDFAVSLNNTYCYRVRAINAGGASGYSNENCQTTFPIFPIGDNAP